MDKMDFLDIGGGFTMVSSTSEKNFYMVAPMITKVLDKHFPDDSVQIIGEPGRFISESVSYLVSRIIG